MNEYRDRFDPKKYEEDEPVAVGYGVPGTPEDWWKDIEDEIAWIPESIFVRAQSIGSAYNLHLIPTINIYERTELNQSQAETLMGELGFIKTVTNDPYLHGWLERAQENVLKVMRSAKETVVIIEGP